MAQDSNFKQSFTKNPDPKLAIDEIAKGLDSKNAKLSVLFVSNQYDCKKLGDAVKEKLGPNVIACTTAGEVSPEGYKEGSISGVSFHGKEFETHTIDISNLGSFSLNESQGLKEEVTAIRAKHKELIPGGKSLALLLIDGMSVKEEILIGLFANVFDDIPIVGGSAGDGLNFGSTFVYKSGTFSQDAATLTIITTSQPFEIFKSHHFTETDKKVVITDSDPEHRIVREIDGMPAAEAYAQLLGIEVSDFSPSVFSKYPLMLKIGDEYYVRSIQTLNEDQSLTFYCAIDTGLVLTLAKKERFFDKTKDLFDHLTKKFGKPECCILFECILRRLEVGEMPQDMQNEIMGLYENNKAIGFHTYGEQYGGVHINQTLTGVAFGKG